MRASSSSRLVRAVAAAMLAGCSACAAPVRQLSPEAWVFNGTGYGITRVEYRPCSQSSTWTSKYEIDVPSGGSMRMDFPEDCVDARLWDTRGRVAGTQSGLRRGSPFRWDLH